MNYLICYDIANPRRLRKAAKILEKMGIRVQYSFFELDISDEMLEHLIYMLKREIDINEDKLYVYPICSSCKKNVTIDGTGTMLKLETFKIL